LKVTGAVSIAPTDFGIKPVKRAFGELRVKDQIQLKFNILAKRKNMIRPSALLFATLIWFSISSVCVRANPLDEPKSPSASTYSGMKPQVELGFNLLYELKFSEARNQFAAWQQMNPEDPLGYVAAASSYLFEEFYDQNVLTSGFFLDDERLLGGIQGKPDEGRKWHFEAANKMGKTLALKRLKINRRDANALFALTVAAGMQADFASILERRQMESLSLIKEAEGYAKQLLAVRPDEADAWVSLGAANYIIGCLPSYKRFFLWFGRIHGDKHLGMEQLQITAEKGNYLKPFAKIFLALASMREKQEDVARILLRDLATQFPENPLFRAELVRLAVPYEGSPKGRQ
jgi:hypothetical protein